MKMARKWTCLRQEIDSGRMLLKKASRIVRVGASASCLP